MEDLKPVESDADGVFDHNFDNLAGVPAGIVVVNLVDPGVGRLGLCGKRRQSKEQ
jgi:hypothetical protein